jgi:hypothetical protein
VNPLRYSNFTGEFGVPGAIAGGIVGALGGAVGASVNGGDVVTGAILGGVGGALVGGLGPLIGPSLIGQALSGEISGSLGNILGQGQRIGTPEFCGFNYSSIAGSAIGGALGATVAPATYGVQFTGSIGAQVLPRAIAGIPAAAYGFTGGVVGTQLGR